MKCIYCNEETNMTVSDIIPAAITGAKLKKKFVCRAHNAFTNDHYEKIIIRQLATFRNRIGLTERDGDPVRFSAQLTIGDYTSDKNIIISDNKSIMETDRLFRMKDKQGNIVLVGPKDKLLKISGATEEKITDLPFADISVNSTTDIGYVFSSEIALHMIAKIAYEWHCYVNDIEEYHEDTYRMITSYILDPDQSNSLVEVVNDAYVVQLTERFLRTGSNMLFEYSDSDGNTYVIFSLWNVIAYKVKICRHNKKPSMVHCPTAYFYHVDGTQNGAILGIYGDFHVNAISPNAGVASLFPEIKKRLSKLGERDLSKEYLLNCIANISKMLPAYQDHKITVAELLDFEHEDKVMPIYILEQIYCHKDEYLPSEDFYQNMQRILRTDDRFVLSNDTVKEILEHYLDMDRNGTFLPMLNEAIGFFEAICGRES